ncbi:cell death-related nuclease 6-like [Perca flavescens]|uniref:cell death-related nuclease 6-like n=1 Tax=Perca flavescens TaxID=8167 RepID=UPI00106DFD0E|nr:cell death-related nuclease 6-like [Perca flavescens]
MMDKDKTGVWLLHSQPRFPYERDEKNFWPKAKKGDKVTRNAQTFICVTFKYGEFQHIGQHLLNIAAYPFESHIPNDFHTELNDAAKKEWNKRKPGERIKDLTSEGTMQFRSFAKKLYTRKLRRRRGVPTPKAKAKANPLGPKKTMKAGKASSQRPKAPSQIVPVTLKDENKFEGDLYLAIADEYQTNVKVQTWGCQIHRDGSYCVQNKHHVIKITSGKTKLGNVAVEWPTTKDHSKWCVGESNNNHLICIADVNRSVKQYERPGGALCFEHQQASELFKGVISETQPCPSPTGAGAGKRRTVRSTDPDPDCNCDSNTDCDSDSD